MDPRADRIELGGPDLLGRLAEWVATSQVDLAAAEHRRVRWLRRAAEETATVTGVLVDLAEQGNPVVVTGWAGRRHRGVIEAVGQDFVGLRLADGSAVLVRTAAVAAVRADGGAPVVTGDRGLAVDVELAEVLAAAVDDRPRLLVVTFADAEGMAGELRSAGRDVVVLRLDGADRATAYVPIAGVAEVRYSAP